MKIKKEITRGLGAVSACLLTVVSIGTPVAEAYEGRLNTVLVIFQKNRTFFLFCNCLCGRREENGFYICCGFIYYSWKCN